MDIDGIEDPLPELGKHREQGEIPPEVALARAHMISAFMRFLSRANECLMVDKAAKQHDDHWGWLIPSIPMQLEIHTHEGVNVMNVRAAIPLDNVLSAMTEISRTFNQEPTTEGDTDGHH